MADRGIGISLHEDRSSPDIWIVSATPALVTKVGEHHQDALDLASVFLEQASAADRPLCLDAAELGGLLIQ